MREDDHNEHAKGRTNHFVKFHVFFSSLFPNSQILRNRVSDHSSDIFKFLIHSDLFKIYLAGHAAKDRSKKKKEASGPTVDPSTTIDNF